MKLHDWQKNTIDKMTERCGLWAFKGAGKSPMGIELLKKFDAVGTVLIITIKSVKRKWNREVKLWDSEHWGRKYIVVTKEEFRRDWKILPKAVAIIFDEAHTGAYTTNGIHKAFMAYKKLWEPRYIHLMTATPILSDVTSVWGLSEMLGRPLGSYWSFKMKYFKHINMGFRKIWKQKRESLIKEEIAKDLASIGVILSKEGIADLPEIHEIEYFGVTAAQKKAIKNLDTDPTTTTPIVYHTKCLQIYSGTLKTEDGHIEVECEKVDRVKELVAENPKCIVVAKYRAELHMLAKQIPNSRIYYGDTSEEDRDEITAQAVKGECVMLLQADSGTGFDLIGIDTIIFYSHTYDYVKYDQCLGRNGGLRQTSKNTYIHLITEKTIDEDVWKCLERKESFNIELYNK